MVTWIPSTGTIRVAKTKAQISFAITAKLICVFVFAYEKFCFSHDMAQIKRAFFTGSLKALGKAGKVVPLSLLEYRAKRVLLKDANLVKEGRRAGVYTKEGGKRRAEEDFAHTFPTNIKMIYTDEGPAQVGYIDNYEVVLRYWRKNDVNIQDTDIPTKYTIRIVKTTYAIEFVDIPLFVHYLEI